MHILLSTASIAELVTHSQTKTPTRSFELLIVDWDAKMSQATVKTGDLVVFRQLHRRAGSVAVFVSCTNGSWFAATTIQSARLGNPTKIRVTAWQPPDACLLCIRPNNCLLRSHKSFPVFFFLSSRRSAKPCRVTNLLMKCLRRECRGCITRIYQQLLIFV